MASIFPSSKLGKNKNPMLKVPFVVSVYFFFFLKWDVVSRIIRNNDFENTHTELGVNFLPCVYSHSFFFFFFFCFVFFVWKQSSLARENVV